MEIAYMEPRLTREADRFIVVLYNAYLANRKEGMTREKAAYMGHANELLELAKKDMPKITEDDVFSYSAELKKAGYVIAEYANNTVYDLEITAHAIVELENRFNDSVKGVLSFLAQFIP